MEEILPVWEFSIFAAFCWYISLPASLGLTNFKNFMREKGYRTCDSGRKCCFAYHWEILLNSAAIVILSTIQGVVCSPTAWPVLSLATGF